MRRTKIVATIGPASESFEMLAQLLAAGMNVARLNFSHCTHASHARVIANLRQAAQIAGVPLAILQDLQGPKIRTGPLVDQQPILLKAGEPFILTTKPMLGTVAKVSTTYQTLPYDVRPGDRILLSDGLLELQVRSTGDNEVATEVVCGGELKENQGINLPRVHISIPALTQKDLTDLAFGLEQGVDYIALSFVREATDIINLRNHITAHGKNVPIIAKIEKPEALDDLPEILKLADGLMVARGDLGVEINPEEVPLVQKCIIRAANEAGIPVITATQMLNSMVANPRPTRAEASDVANAILDGTDAIMLSGETASGQFPLEAVRMMDRIARAVESSVQPSQVLRQKLQLARQQDTAHAICAAASTLVEDLEVQALVAFTFSGKTARLMAQHRPKVPILAFTPNEEIYQRLSLLWGLTPILSLATDDLEALNACVYHNLTTRGFAQPHDLVVLLGGHPLTIKGKTNFLKVARVEELIAGQQLGAEGQSN